MATVRARSGLQTETERRRAVKQLCEQLGLVVDAVHLDEALTHPSFANEQRRAEQGRIKQRGIDNQRLEFLGDAVLGLCISELLMKSFAEVDEGQLTVMRAALVNAEALAAVARQLDLGAAMRLGRGAEGTGERQRTNVLADGFEALMGAVFLDNGLDAARAITGSLFAEQIAALVANRGIERDSKSRLQERLQAGGSDPPQYRVVAEHGPPHDRCFVVLVQVLDSTGQLLVTAEGSGRSKKLAEQAAAGMALSRLDHLDE